MHICVCVHVVCMYIYMYTHIISGPEKPGQEMIFAIVILVLLAHAYANKNCTCPILMLHHKT